MGQSYFSGEQNFTCYSVEFGDAACTPHARRRRHADYQDFQKIEVSYSVNGTHFHIDEGVVLVLESTSSFTHMAPFAALALALALF